VDRWATIDCYGHPSVSINQLGEPANRRPSRELADLSRLPDALDELVPA
jgi:hypothetical protein